MFLANLGVPVVFNTGRTDLFLRERVVKPLLAAGLSPDARAFGVCEKGAVWCGLTMNNYDGIHVDPDLKLPSEILHALKGLFDSDFTSTMFWDEHKRAMASQEQRIDVDSAAFLPERDRFAEICFRFFFGLLTREHIAAGDPHPGNVLLAADDKVVFLDFGFIRHVAPDYLEGERGLARAVLAGDAEEVKRCMTELGYLPDPGGFTGEDLLAQLLVAAEWYFDPAFRRLDPEYVRFSLEQGSSPRSPFFSQMRRQTIPAQALLIRRMEGLLFAVYGELRAGANWNALAREYISGEGPSTPLGEVEHDWMTGAPSSAAAA